MAGGAALGGLGLMARDPDSPGIERTLAVVGFAAGCFAGGTVGLIGGVVSRGPWVEVNLEQLSMRTPPG